MAEASKPSEWRERPAWVRALTALAGWALTLLVGKIFGTLAAVGVGAAVLLWLGVLYRRLGLTLVVMLVGFVVGSLGLFVVR